MNSGCAACGTGTLYPQTRLGRAMMNGVQSKTMAKVVYNACFGGFSLSNEAMDRMVELGYSLEPNPKYNSNSNSKYGDSSQKYKCWGYVDCPRHHPILVQVVEELGEKASGNCANLRIEEVEGIYRIDEYDGIETVVAPDGYDWENANEFIV
jgi:hypothetical protein